MSKQVNTFTNDALGNLDATGIAEAIASKKISPKEAIEAAINRADKADKSLNAIVLRTYNDATDLSRLKQDGAFYGVPMFFKDTDNIKGYPTQMGTGAFSGRKAGKNSRFVNQFLSMGVSSLGKTTLPEFGLLCSTENERWAVTCNPWNTDYTSGGSSSGSAALVASGAVPFASGNDGAGSIRIPSAICGLVGLKPSRYRIHGIDGTEMMPIEIIHQGVLTRSVRDTAAFYSEAEKFHKNKRLPEIGLVTTPPAKRLRIAMVENLDEGTTGRQDEDTYNLQQKTAKLLESLGHTVDLVPLPINVDTMVGHFLNYYGFLSYMSSNFGRLVFKSKVDKSQLEPFTTGLAQRFRRNALKLPRSISEMRKMGRECGKLFETYDVVMSPVLAHKTPEIGYFSPELSYEEVTKRAIDFATYTGLYNVTGEPAISLPLGRDADGMPLGVQFAAPYGEDRRLLELAIELEQAQPWETLANSN